MRVIPKNTGTKRVDVYNAQPGSVVTRDGKYYLVTHLPGSMFMSRGSIAFIDVVTGVALGDTNGTQFLVCDKAELHVSVLED